MLIVVNDQSCQIPVPADIAVCPDCCGSLNALPNEIEKCGSDPDTYQVFTPTLFCQNDVHHGDDMVHHGDDMTDDWFATYDAVADWFGTITVKCPVFPS